MNSRILRWGLALAACVCACLQPAAGATVSPEVARGLAWLQAQVKSDGSVVGEASSVAKVAQLRSEVATTLSLLSASAPDALLDQITASSPFATELLARKIIALQSAGRSADGPLAELAASQNVDGGFGGEPGFASNALDTAWALLAWTHQPPAYANEIKAAVQWLVSAQSATGYWQAGLDGPDVSATALAVQALAAYRGRFTLATNLNKGRSWLGTQKASDASWGSDAQTAHALLALLPAATDVTPYQNTMDALIARQEADGSWQGDAYATAIVLRALLLAAQPVTNPDLASITGVIKDADTGSPIASAVVSLNGGQLTALTDSTGKFFFQALLPGEVRLDVSVAGYRGRETSTILTAGAAVDYGDVLLKKADASGVTVSGVVYFTPAYGTRNVANAATVREILNKW